MAEGSVEVEKDARFFSCLCSLQCFCVRNMVLFALMSYNTQHDNNYFKLILHVLGPDRPWLLGLGVDGFEMFRGWLELLFSRDAHDLDIARRSFGCS